MKELVSPFVWQGIGAPSSVTNNCTFVENVKQLFAARVAGSWEKRDGGVTYSGITGKVKGWHMVHCTLRDIETADEGANNKRKRIHSGPSSDVVSPEVAAARVVIHAPSMDEYSSPEAAMRGLVSKVAKLYVPGVLGKWITPIVRALEPHASAFPVCSTTG